MENFPFFIFSSIISFSFCNLFYIRNYIDQFICFLFGWLVNQNHHHQHEVAHMKEWYSKPLGHLKGTSVLMGTLLPYACSCQQHLHTIPRFLHKWSLSYWLRNLCLLTNYSNIPLLVGNFFTILVKPTQNLSLLIFFLLASYDPSCRV